VWFKRIDVVHSSVCPDLCFLSQTTILDEVVGYGIAALGFLWQFGYGFRLPFPLNILLLPIRLIEFCIVWFIMD